jgi:hypothetical protein
MKVLYSRATGKLEEVCTQCRETRAFFPTSHLSVGLSLPNHWQAQFNYTTMAEPSGRAIQGYIDPNFPNPMTESSASIIIYGYSSKADDLKPAKRLT